MNPYVILRFYILKRPHSWTLAKYIIESVWYSWAVLIMYLKNIREKTT